MASVENLLLEIFRKKNEIIQQVKQFTDSYAQYHNLKLLDQGIPPPPWLLEDIHCSEAPTVSKKANAMDASPLELPQDVINLVLLRLPASSVARFRCVSKSWRSFLTSFTFMKSHHDLHINSSCATSIVIPVSSDKDADPPFPPHLHVITTDRRSRKVTSPFFRGHKIVLRAVCHGFILIELSECDALLVFNPVTLEAVEVSGCIYDPSGGYGNYCQFGLGYNSSSDDYNIVRIRIYYNDYFNKICEWSVYSLKKKSWSRLRVPPEYPVVPEQDSYPFVNGRLHFPAWFGGGTLVGGGALDRACGILAYDMAREEFVEISPPCNEFHLDSGVLTVFGRCFAVMLFPSDDVRTEFWVMKEYGDPESWHKIVVVNHNRDGIRHFILLSGEDELVLLVCEEETWIYKLRVYSLSTGVSRVWDVGLDIGRAYRYGIATPMPFTECLLSPTTYDTA